MPAVVRVKRRIDEEPHSAFVLNGKKRRLDNNEETTDGELSAKDEISTVLKFAGTIKEQDDTATTQFAARLNKSDAKQLVQEKTTSRRQQLTNPTERARKEIRQAQSEQRFRVVNCQRATLDVASTANEQNNGEQEPNTNSGNSGNSSSAITIVDIEPTAGATDIATQQQSMPDLNGLPADSDTGYVYDLYLPENEQQAAYVDMMDDNYLSVRLFDDWMYEDCYNNEDEEYDSEDSNQENYFTNDYPDEDDDKEMFSDANGGGNSDEELCNAVRGFILDDDDDDVAANSSDDDDQDYYRDSFVHSVNADEENFVDDVDYIDVQRYGVAYAKYRARVLKQLENSNNDDDDSDSGEEHFESASENEG